MDPQQRLLLETSLTSLISAGFTKQSLPGACVASFLGITNAVDIALKPATRDRVDVQFERFRLGPISFPAPKTLTGSLETTFLDEDLRISRGDKDNVFVLLRESSMRETADEVWAGWRESW